MNDTIQDELRAEARIPQHSAHSTPEVMELMDRAAERIETLEEQLAVEKYRTGSMEHAVKAQDGGAGDTIQDQLRTLADEPNIHAHVNTLLYRAAEYIDGLETSESGDASEWIAFLWGGGVRRSEVSGVDERVDGAGRTHVQVWRGEVAHDSPGDDAQAKAWLSDIEGQLGIVR